MMNLNKRPNSEAGFTLVELAIVMIIIGLLIAGVLKGQQLIGNARVTSTVAQIKSIDAAVSTFKDMYQGMPGDLQKASSRLPNCTGNCGNATGGNGDGQLIAFAAPSLGNENSWFFPQLAAADLVTGIVPNNGLVFGGVFPAAKLDGVGIVPGYSGTTVTLPGGIGLLGTGAGTYLALTSSPTAVPGTGTVSMSPVSASRIDTKLDDGVPSSGSTVAIGTSGTGASDCATAADATGLYNTTVTSNSCGLYTRIQG